MTDHLLHGAVIGRGAAKSKQRKDVKMCSMLEKANSRL